MDDLVDPVFIRPQKLAPKVQIDAAGPGGELLQGDEQVSCAIGDIDLERQRHAHLDGARLPKGYVFWTRGTQSEAVFTRVAAGSTYRQRVSACNQQDTRIDNAGFIAPGLKQYIVLSFGNFNSSMNSALMGLCQLSGNFIAGLPIKRITLILTIWCDRPGDGLPVIDAAAFRLGSAW